MFSLESISEANCNARLKKMYEERDRLSRDIDRFLSYDLDSTVAESRYHAICEVIAQYCKWRNDHPGCLLEGDPGYTLS